MNGVLISATGKVALCDLCKLTPADPVYENTFHVCHECYGCLEATEDPMKLAGLKEMDPFLRETYRVKAHCKRKFADGGAA